MQICPRDSLRACQRLRTHPEEMTDTAGVMSTAVAPTRLCIWQTAATPAPILGGPQWRGSEGPNADLGPDRLDSNWESILPMMPVPEKMRGG